MSLKNERKRSNTEAKLARLLERRRKLSDRAGGDEALRLLTMESLRKTILQFQEEIARYDAGRRVRGETTKI